VILVVGSKSDPTVAHTLARADELRLAYDFLETEHLRRAAIAQSGCDCKITVEGRSIQLSRYSGIYNRLLIDRSLIQVAGRRLAFNAALLCSAFRTHSLHGLVVNKPDLNDVNSSKIHQTIILKRYGFHVPESIATNSPRLAMSFCSGTRRIYKSLSSIRSIVSSAPPQSSKRFENLRNAPCLFQERVDGLDARVHMVGGDMFCELISSSDIDYRYSASQNLHSAGIVPDDIRRLLVDYMSGTGLEFGGADFKIDLESGVWMLLEINTMPGYSGYDQRTGGDISRALLIKLSRGRYP
jgi:glutathione synthase/RimK-type ligase-like ATP-grasp enzyme